MLFICVYCYSDSGFVLTACEKPAVTLTTPKSVNGFKLNTYVQIDSYTSVSKNTLTEALNLCDYYENIFSRTKEDSELSKVNSNQTTDISKEMYELVSAGLEYAALSNGAFDITIGSVSRLWDFTAESPKVPDSGRISEALTHVDYTRVSVSDNGDGTYSISKPDDVILDLGAVAKGYIADKIKDFLEENGVKRAIINLGGNVLCIGKKTNTDNFGIGVRKHLQPIMKCLLLFPLMIPLLYHLATMSGISMLMMEHFIIIYLTRLQAILMTMTCLMLLFCQRIRSPETA